MLGTSSPSKLTILGASRPKQSETASLELDGGGLLLHLFYLDEPWAWLAMLVLFAGWLLVLSFKAPTRYPADVQARAFVRVPEWTRAKRLPLGRYVQVPHPANPRVASAKVHIDGDEYEVLSVRSVEGVTTERWEVDLAWNPRPYSVSPTRSRGHT